MTQPTVPPVPGASPRPDLRCPLCGHGAFTKEDSRSDSRWGFTSHRMTLLICDQCR